jgi:hypothetical protein
MAEPEKLFIVHCTSIVFHARDEQHASDQWLRVARGETDHGAFLLNVEPFDPNDVQVKEILPDGTRIFDFKQPD